MEPQRKQIISIGNGPSAILAEPGEGPTAEPLIKSPPNIASDSGNTTNEEEPVESPISSASLESLNSSPTSIAEALGLLQMRCFELRSLGLKLIIEGTPGGKLGIVISWTGHKLDYKEGHILADTIPVLDIKEDK